MNPANVLITTSPYTTLLYFLISDLQDINNTAYFFVINQSWAWDETERNRIRKELPASYFIIESKLDIRFRKNKITRRLNSALNLIIHRCIPYIFMRLSKNFRWPFINKAKIYAYDAASVEAALIGKNDYIFLEEGLFTYENADRFAKNNSLDFKMKNMFAKPFGIRGLAADTQARKIILTGIAAIPECYKTRNLEVVSMPELWEKSDRDKQDFIMRFFELSEDDVADLKSRDIIVLDQPLASDGFITTEEQIELFRKILEHYGASRVLLKTHYRNSIDYRAIFPDVMVWDKLTPMELLNLCGASFTKAVTINSTSVLTFPESTKIEWLGRDINSPYFSHLSGSSRKIFGEFITRMPVPTRIAEQNRSMLS